MSISREAYDATSSTRNIFGLILKASSPVVARQIVKDNEEELRKFSAMHIAELDTSGYFPETADQRAALDELRAAIIELEEDLVADDDEDDLDDENNVQRLEMEQGEYDDRLQNIIELLQSVMKAFGRKKGNITSRLFMLWSSLYPPGTQHTHDILFELFCFRRGERDVGKF